MLPHSLGFLYEELTEHLGFNPSSDEYKVMALAAYGKPRFIDELRRTVQSTPEGGFRVERIGWETLATRRDKEERWQPEHADLAASVQSRVEEVLLELARWLHERTGHRRLAMAGGVALNCVANSRLWREGPFEEVWVQPAAGDAGTALGAALNVAHAEGDGISPMTTVALGRAWSDEELEAELRMAGIPYRRPRDIAQAAAEVIAADGIVGWFQGASEWGPRALGHRSLLADASRRQNLERLNRIKGREQFRPLAPMVLDERARDIFDGPIPAPYMLFTQHVKSEWRDRIPAVVHVDGTARAQTVDRRQEPLLARLLTAVEIETGVPVVVNTSFNSAGRPIVDHPRDALEVFGSSPMDALAIGPFLLRRSASLR